MKNLKDADKFDWPAFLKYVSTYNFKTHGGSDPKIVLQDLLYGIGVSFGHEFRFADGFVKFKRLLAKMLREERRDMAKHLLRMRAHRQDPKG